MPQDLPLVWRFPRSEKNPKPKFSLVRVDQEGSRPLDVKLSGTNGSEVFTVSLKHNKTSSLKAKNSKNSQAEWEKILSTVLLADSEGVDIGLVEGLEAVTTVESEIVDGEETGISLTVIIQKRIEGITQRLGEIFLPADDRNESAIDIFEWTGLVIESKDTIQKELEITGKILRKRDDHIKRLDDSLAELAKLKNENEDQLLEKFSLLLNEKKLKIRDQQRLLASSTVDPVKLEEVEGNRAGIRERSAGPSRARKRKVGVQTDSEESDDGFEKMEVDIPTDMPVEDSDKEDERTASETESDSDAPPVAPPSRKTRGASTQPSVTKSPAKVQPNVPPPKRELPFAKKPPPKPVPPVEGSETESDDEL